MIQRKKKICKSCGNEYFIFSKGMCKFCASKNYKAPSTTIKPKKNKMDLDNFFIQKIEQLLRLGKSEESGKKIPHPTRANICHLFNKRNHPSVAYHPDNYVFLTIDEHSELDNKCLDVNDFKELNKRFPVASRLILERMEIVRKSVTEKTKFVEAFDNFIKTLTKI